MAQNEFKSLVTILVIIHVLYTSYYLVTWDVSIVKSPLLLSDLNHNQNVLYVY